MQLPIKNKDTFQTYLIAVSSRVIEFRPMKHKVKCSFQTELLKNMGVPFTFISQFWLIEIFC